MSIHFSCKKKLTPKSYKTSSHDPGLDSEQWLRACSRRERPVCRLHELITGEYYAEKDVHVSKIPSKEIPSSKPISVQLVNKKLKVEEGEM